MARIFAPPLSAAGDRQSGTPHTKTPAADAVDLSELRADGTAASNADLIRAARDLIQQAFGQFQYQTPPLARGRDGIHELLDIETARATADTLTTLHYDLTHGVGISGPAARRAIHAAAQAPTFAGAIRTHRQARDILGNPALIVYDNPRSLLMCVYNRDWALCHRLDATDAPRLDRCQPSCANIARTDHQVGALHQSMTENRVLRQKLSEGAGVVRVLPQLRNGHTTHPAPPDPT
ncbi:hypothetical protein [Streptomyces sp. BE133]|uniref:hypothetical protein n=1 Tax=Streptomyces sp. BE133 TaxID=3002523 RepID=UPI002E7A4CF1|nr:hypothetical protein [Streptomyces sp. BE133]MEE1809445.1 hypothetical protein [Streptomyces sp. BE133]